MGGKDVIDEEEEAEATVVTEPAGEAGATTSGVGDGLDVSARSPPSVDCDCGISPSPGGEAVGVPASAEAPDVD